MPLEHFKNSDFLESTQQKSCWNLPKKSHNDTYLQIRAETEQHFWNYSLEDAKKVISDYSDNKQVGRNIRPVYASLNISKNHAGGALGYGLAYFTLNPQVKYRATLIPDDSYDLYQVHKIYTDTGVVDEKTDRVEACRFFEIGKLLYFMDEGKLKRLIDGESTPNDYIELQIHGKVDFDEDIKELTILRTAPEDTKLSGLAGFSSGDQEAIIDNATAFAKKNNIKARIIEPDGKTITILNDPVEAKSQVISNQVKSSIPDYKAWKYLSYRFARSRSAETLLVDRLVEQYTFLASNANLTTRLMAVMTLQKTITEWLEFKKNKSCRVDAMKKLLISVNKEHENLACALADTLNNTSRHYRKNLTHT